MLKNEISVRPTKQEIDSQQEKSHNFSKDFFSIAENELVSLKTKTVKMENNIETLNQLNFKIRISQRIKSRKLTLEHILWP